MGVRAFVAQLKEFNNKNNKFIQYDHILHGITDYNKQLHKCIAIIYSILKMHQKSCKYNIYKFICLYLIKNYWSFKKLCLWFDPKGGGGETYVVSAMIIIIYYY